MGCCKPSRYLLLGGPGDLVSKVISRVIIGVAPFRVLITLLITYLLSPLPLQAGFLSRVSRDFFKRA